MEPEITRNFLSTIDYVIIAVYMGGLVFMGLYYRKFAQQDLESYFLGGRKLKGWMSGTSYAVTCMNADVAPAYCGMTVITGVWIYWWYISRFGLALMIGAILFAVFWRRLQIFTSPEFYEKRFSGTPAMIMRSWITLRSAFIAVVAWTAAGLVGMAKISNALLGWGRWETFALFVPVILVYVILSGYLGVVVSDLIQSAVLIFSSIILMVLVLQDFGGAGGLFTALQDQFGTSVTQWHPPSSHELLGVVGVIAWTIGTAVGYGGDVAPMSGAMEGQRLLSCKNNKEASKMYIWTQAVLFLMLAVLTLPALGAMLQWPGLHTGEINKELAFGLMIGHYLPTGLLGLAVVAILASIMSTVDSNMNFGAQVFINDIYKRYFKPDASLKNYMTVGKLVMAVIMGMALFVAFSAQNVIDISVFMLGLSSAELTANWGQWWWWRFNAKARLAASFGGPLVFLLNKYVVFVYLFDQGQNTTYWVILSSIGFTLILWLLVTLFTKPDHEEVLVRFYKEARPLGFWRPIARKAGFTPEPKPGNTILKGLLIAFTGFVTIGSAVIALAHAYIARWEIVFPGLLIFIIAGWLFIKMYQPFFNKVDQR